MQASPENGGNLPPALDPTSSQGKDNGHHGHHQIETSRGPDLVSFSLKKDRKASPHSCTHARTRAHKY